ncbi:MAG: hypothetical protein JXB35_16625 [Anaerolineae bacterium]|nr:hypothetical protein [Anaerolineae bacterium]
MWRFSWNLALKIALGFLVIAAGLGALGALFTGGWGTVLALLFIAGVACWGLRKLGLERPGGPP